MDDKIQNELHAEEEEETEVLPPRKHAKPQSKFKTALNVFMGKNRNGTRKKAIPQTKAQTFFRLVTVLFAFLGIAGLAAIAYQAPKISEEDGFNFTLFEESEDTNRTDEEREYDKKATAENAFAYRVKEDGTVAVVGYVGTESKVAVPRKIEGKTVTEIAPGAFMNQAISSITVYKDVTSIGQSAFMECEILFEANLPDTVTYIGDGAFYNCPTLRRIHIPAGIKEIGNSVFSGCTSLVSVTFSGGVTKIGRNAFEGCVFTSIALPATLKATDIGAFRNCKQLTDVLLPEGFESLGEETFAGCTALKNVTLGSTVSHLGARAFADCKALQEIQGGSGVATVGADCFDGAEMKGKTDYQLILGNGILVKYFGNNPHVSIYPSVNVIGNSAFKGNTALQTVNVPSSADIQDHAFQNCTALTQVALAQNIKKIGKEAFSGCISLSFAQLPAELTQLGEGAFAMCTSLKGVALPPSLKAIPANAFARCVSIIEVTFNGQTEVGNGAFSNCAMLSSISLTASMKKVGDYAFADCGSLKTIKLGSNLQSIGEHAFRRIGASSAHLPDSLSYIAETAFSACPFLKALYATRGTYGHTWAANHGL